MTMTEGAAAAEHPDGPSAVLSAVIRDGEPRTATAGREGSPSLRRRR